MTAAEITSEVSFIRVNEILKTLPIGYYLGRSIPVTLSEGYESYYDLVADKIVISYQNILSMITTAINTGSDLPLEYLIRGVLYHEISHVILTPKNLFRFASNKKEKDIINIFEDERIETIFADYYMNVDFKKSIILLNNWTPDKPIRSALDLFYNTVRFRCGYKTLVNRVNQIITKYMMINSSTADYDDIKSYVNAIIRLYEDCEKLFDEYKEEEKKRKEDEEKKEEEKSSGSDSDDSDETSGSDNKDSDKPEGSDTDDSDEPNESDKDSDNSKNADSDKSDEDESDKDESDNSNDSTNEKYDTDLNNTDDFEDSKKSDPDGTGKNESDDSDESDTNSSTSSDSDESDEDMKPSKASSDNTNENTEDKTDSSPDGSENNTEEPEDKEDEKLNELLDNIKKDIPEIDQDVVRNLARSAINQLINKYYSEELYNSLNKIIELALKKNSSSGSAINAYSGKLDIRSIARRDDYKWWSQQNRKGHIRQFSKVHFNLFIDNSGSFYYNDSAVNTLIQTLKKIKNPDFDFDIITINMNIDEWTDIKIFKSTGGNRLTPIISNVIKRHQKIGYNNYNIVLFDGDAHTDDHCRFDYEPFRYFDSPNSIIITDSDNKKYLVDVKKAKIVYTRDYYKEFLTHILDLLSKVIL